MIQAVVGKYRVQVLKRKQAHSKKGERVYSTVYNNAIDAENVAFSFRCDHGSISCKKD